MSHHSPEFLKRNRIAYAGNHSFVLLIGVISILTGLGFLVDPNAVQYQVTALLDPPFFQYLWSVLFIIGGTAICTGLISLSLRIEAVGHTTLATAIIIDGLMSARILDYGLFASWSAAAIFIVSFVAIMFRLWALFEAISLAEGKLLFVSKRRLKSK